MLLTLALFVTSFVIALLAYWVRRNDATTAATLEEVRALAVRVEKVHATVFGPNNDNGLHGDNAITKRRLHRLAGFMQGLSLFLGLECDDDGRLRWSESVSPFEQRLQDRRVGHGRRATDG